ncbi:PREDICTED: putative FBD-associated F-box protein At3g50710 [Theobroma cacao]|uniref:FBD-associated F-box protein At3g50710 n=1 Tax=Theobroma cacao TaxID=3641 RepID=A0AB32WFX5_THECC|nr:PREDICTED: putative FBD-associated F-box protein At3g50710 [Theobroma cacao]
MTIPTHVCLPSLKSLHCSGVDFIDNDFFQRLLFRCLVLEELLIHSFNNFHNLRELHISKPLQKRLTLEHQDDTSYQPLHVGTDAPSLVYIKYTSSIGSIRALFWHQLENIPSCLFLTLKDVGEHIEIIRKLLMLPRQSKICQVEFITRFIP